MKRENDEWDQCSIITIELFPNKLPKSCHRFSRLAKGKLDDAENPGYIGSKLVRVQKDSFIQFGEVPGVVEKYGVLEDEAYVVKHDQPGIVGFVGGNTRHSNVS